MLRRVSPVSHTNIWLCVQGADVRNESSYLHPGGVDVFRERRAGSRGRTGRESPRSAASVTHRYNNWELTVTSQLTHNCEELTNVSLSLSVFRYHSMTGESGGLSCSHLQDYDPDRALTDYISRLEALQRRLGSVQSGNHQQSNNTSTSAMTLLRFSLVDLFMKHSSNNRHCS